MSSKPNLPWKNYSVSKAQLKVLVEKAGEDAVKAALIQNGSAPEEFSHYTVSKKQLETLVEKAGSESVVKALIQNGSAPEEFNGAR